MTKKKILWVVYDFVQAGGQRYVYEICKALDKEKYSIDFLKAAPMNHDGNWDKEFYYEPSIRLGSKVYFLDALLTPEQKKKNLVSRGWRFLRRKLPFFPGQCQPHTSGVNNKKLIDFLDGYEIVNFSGVAVYQTCIKHARHQPGYFIHILTFGFQHEDMYQGYDRSLHYNFITPVTPKAAHKDLEGFTDYNLTYFPLCFETRPYEVNFSDRQKYSIAIFTRLSPMKPLDPFFYTLKILKEQGVEVTLLLYGAGDPKALGITRQLDYLYLSDDVQFMGHTEDIPQTLSSNPPDLIWFQSANKEPGGYAAFEISMSAIPQLFWDFKNMNEPREIAEFFPSFTSLLHFATKTTSLLADASQRKSLGEKQRNYVLAHYNVTDHIHIIETLYDAL